MWLCIDQGGHSTRAAVIDETGRIVLEEKASVETEMREPCYVEHDAGQLLDSVKACLRAIAELLGSGCARLRAAGIATQRSTLVCAARGEGTALSPVISRQDRRGQADLARFEPHADRIKALTGLKLSPHYGVGKLRWCLENLDDVRRHREARDLIGAPLAAFLLHHLAGEGRWRVDPVNASRTLLMDIREARWSRELLEIFDIDAALLPDIRPCRSSFGTLEIGSCTVPLSVCTGDQAAAIYCVGEAAAGTAFVNIGTGAFIQVLTDQTPVLDEDLLSSVVWQDAQATRYVLEGTVNGAAAAIDAVADDLGRHFDPQGPELRGALARIADAPLFLNGVSGLGSPDWIADFASRFTRDADPVLQIAAVYESIVFLIVRNLRRMRRRVRLDRLVVTGGVSRLDWLAQRLADVSGLPVLRPEEAEATLLGLGYLVSRGRCRPAGEGARFEPAADAVAGRRFRDWTAAMDRAIGAGPT